MMEELSKAYLDQTRLVVFRGSGRDFCLGTENPGSSDGGMTLSLQIENLLSLISRAPFFSVACLHGATFDVGADVAVMCDWRLLSPQSQLCFAKARSPDTVPSARRLKEIVGGFHAFDFLVRRTLVHAQTALDCGLATELVAAEAMPAYLGDLLENLQKTEKQSIAILREATGARDGTADLERVVRSSAAGHRQSAR
jgi:enoyl-CoA hydratase/carnithine racemase